MSVDGNAELIQLRLEEIREDIRRYHAMGEEVPGLLLLKQMDLSEQWLRTQLRVPLNKLR